MTDDRECDDLTLMWRKTTIATRVHVGPTGNIHPVLLGRSDFFTLFVVRFNWHRDPPVFDLDLIV